MNGVKFKAKEIYMRYRNVKNKRPQPIFAMSRGRSYDQL